MHDYSQYNTDCMGLYYSSHCILLHTGYFGVYISMNCTAPKTTILWTTWNSRYFIKSKLKAPLCVRSRQADRRKHPTLR